MFVQILIITTLFIQIFEKEMPTGKTEEWEEYFKGFKYLFS